ncbi:MAG: hypothetical protein IPK10_15545 [Bacteroidetes bacterium]|nr:hypothetical protein [Bacteroidota bacterium]
MRKILCTLLLTAYLIPAIGVGINLHWCGHILFAFSMSSDDHTNCMCAQFKEVGDNSKSDCCKDDYVYYKLSQQHTSSSIQCLTYFDKSMSGYASIQYPSFRFIDFVDRKCSLVKSMYSKDERPPDITLLSVFRV